MKILCLAATINLFLSYAFASGGERVCFATVNGPDCSVSHYGYVNPSQSVDFIVDQISPPAGYVSAANNYSVIFELSLVKN
jgi:hypothetical protein